MVAQIEIGNETAAFLGLYHAMRAAIRSIEMKLLPYHVSLPQADLLTTLRRIGPVTAGELARELKVAQQGMSMTLDRLELMAGGPLVRRFRRSGNDRRQVRVELTERGRAVAEVLEPALERAVEECREGSEVAHGEVPVR